MDMTPEQARTEMDADRFEDYLSSLGQRREMEAD
jgi:hypothetical protein